MAMCCVPWLLMGMPFAPFTRRSDLVLDARVGDREELGVDLLADAREGGVAAFARPRQIHVDEAADRPGAARHDGDAVPEEDRLVDVVRDEDDGGALRLPDPEQLLLHLD